MKKYLGALLILVIMPLQFCFAQTKPNHHKTAKHKAAASHARGVANVRHKKSVTKGHTNKVAVHHNKSAAKHHTKRVAVHHPVKGHSKVMTPKTITLDNHSAVAVVEIKNGKIYVNDDLVSGIKSLKNEDQKIIINYLAPVTTPVTDISHSDAKNTEREASEKPLLGIHTGNYYDEGAMVEAILPYSPADDAGLYPGDIITGVNDAKIKNTDELINALNAYNKGDKISLTYKDYERTETVNVKLAGKEAAEDCDCPEVYPSFARW